MPGTSPAVTALPDGGFAIAYQASDHSLRTVDGTMFQGESGPGAQLSPGTSPSISAYVLAGRDKSAPDNPPVPQPYPATSYTLFNCSHINLPVDQGLGRTVRVWLKDDSVHGSKFANVATLSGLLVSWSPGRART